MHAQKQTMHRGARIKRTLSLSAPARKAEFGISKAPKRQLRQIDALDAMLWSTVPYHPFLDRTRLELACFCASPAMVGGSRTNQDGDPKEES